MKTDNFDDSIKNKLNSLNQPSTDAEIDHVHQYIQTNLHATKVSSIRKYILIGSTVITIGSLVLWSTYIYNENKNLEHKIEKLTDEIKHTNQADTDIQKNNKAIESSTLEINKSSENTSNQHTKNTISDFKENKNKSADNRIYTGNKTAKLTLVKNTELDRKSSQLVENNQNNISKIEELTANNIQKVEDPKEQITELSKPDSVLKPDSIYMLADGKKPKPRKKTNLSYLVGLEYDKGKFSSGMSLQNSLVLNNQWSFSLGLRMVNPIQERFHDKDDFHDRRGSEFQKTYPSEVVDTIAISNINIHTHIIQLPVYIGYILPIKKQFSLVLNAATDLDIRTKQEVEYRHPINFPGEERKEFHSHVAPTVFNNLCFSVGLQKQINNFQFQISPYVYSQTKQVAYKNNESYLGIRFRALYSFKI